MADTEESSRLLALMSSGALDPALAAPALAVADQTRERVLVLLRNLATLWVRSELRIITEHGTNTSSMPTWADVRAFGSGALGAHTATSDLDCVVLTPGFTCRQRFTTHFPALLQQHTDVEHVLVITATNVPVVRFDLGGTEVDVVFAACRFLAPPTDEQLQDDECLSMVLPESRLSLNGVRTGLQFRALVPAFGTFTAALRVVKAWAKARRVYGGNFGFPNGVAFAVLVARVAQLFPEASAAALVRRFFDVYDRWLERLDAVKPIWITPTSDPYPGRPRLDGMPECWDAARSDDALVALNPAYPYLNTAFTVDHATLHWLAREVARARWVLGGGAADATWLELVRPARALEDPSLRSAVVVRVPHGTPKYVAFVESKMKLLTFALRAAGLTPRPHPDRIVHSTVTAAASFLVGLDLEATDIPTHVALRRAVDEFTFAVSAKAQRGFEAEYPGCPAPEVLLLSARNPAVAQLVRAADDPRRSTKSTPAPAPVFRPPPAAATTATTAVPPQPLLATPTVSVGVPPFAAPAASGFTASQPAYGAYYDPRLFVQQPPAYSTFQWTAQ